MGNKLRPYELSSSGIILRKSATGKRVIVPLNECVEIMNDALVGRKMPAAAASGCQSKDEYQELIDGDIVWLESETPCGDPIEGSHIIGVLERSVDLEAENAALRAAGQALLDDRDQTNKLLRREETSSAYLRLADVLQKPVSCQEFVS